MRLLQQFDKLSVPRRVLMLLVFSMLITFSTFAIVTRRNVPMDFKAVAIGQYSITGQYLVTLPCGYPGYDSSRPILPEERGFPLNYNYWTPCSGHKILRDGFLLDYGFWTILISSVYGFHVFRNRKVARHVH